MEGVAAALNLLRGGDQPAAPVRGAAPTVGTRARLLAVLVIAGTLLTIAPAASLLAAS